MKVYFAATEAFPRAWSYADYFTGLAARDRVGAHALTDDPAGADLILFVDPQLPHPWTLDAIRAHPYLKRYPDKTLIYNERDLSWRVLPGVYPSVLASVYDPERQRSYAYLRDYGEPAGPGGAAADAPDLLFSFMGAANHAVRRQVLALSHPRACLEDTSSAKFHDYSGGRDELDIQRQRQHYQEVMRRSKFILCPRGVGASSFRIFETLRAGRVPVVISDEWTAPGGPDWAGCGLRVREADVASIPRLLESREGDFERLSECATRTYAEWFAPDVIFHRTIEKCEELLRAGAGPITHSRFLDRQFLRCGFDETANRTRHRISRVTARLKYQLSRRGGP